MSIENLEWLWKRVDRIDRDEGLRAYSMYNAVMRRLSEEYGIELERVVAAFVSLSPNNDYVGNLNSTRAVLRGVRDSIPVEEITVTTYKHCRNRAYALAAGLVCFDDFKRGPKITAFYHNILDPENQHYVTIDGHMVAAYRGQQLTMKEAIPNGLKEYRLIADAIKLLAFRNFLIPCQMQATLWFTRKRIYRIKI